MYALRLSRGAPLSIFTIACSSTTSSATRQSERTITINSSCPLQLQTCRGFPQTLGATVSAFAQAKAMAQAQPFEVHYHPHVNVDITSSWDNFNYEHCTMGDGPCTSSGVVSSLCYFSEGVLLFPSSGSKTQHLHCHMAFSSVSRISATFARAASVVLGLQRVAQTKQVR